MTWRETHGMKPRTSAEKVFVRYRCGLESKQAYPVRTTRWDHRGDDFDVVAYAKDEAA